MIERDGTDRNRAGRNHCVADVVDATARAQVHDRIGPVLYSQLQLLQLPIDVGGQGGIADVGVDLDGGHCPDPHRLEAGMMNVTGNNESATGHLGPNDLGLETFPLGDVGHFRSDNPLAGVVHLRDAVPIAVSSPCDHVRLLLRKAKTPARHRQRYTSTFSGYSLRWHNPDQVRRSATVPVALSVCFRRLPYLLPIMFQSSLNQPRCQESLKS